MIIRQLIFTSLGIFSVYFYRCFKRLVLKAVFPIVIVFANLILGYGLDIVQAGSPESPSVPILDEQHVKPHLDLTKEERIWLDNHSTIRFTGDPDWLPQEAFTEDGKQIGMAAEVLDLLESRLGVNFERVPPKTWSEAVRIAEDREVDILSETSDVTREGLSFTDPYLVFPVSIIIRAGSFSTLKPEDLGGKSVAVVRDYGYVQIFQRKYPDLDYMVVDSVREGLLSVSSGHADVFLSATSTASYLISELGLTNLRFSGYTELSIDLAFAVRNDWPVLLSIMQKGLDSITQTEFLEITRRWITLDDKSLQSPPIKLTEEEHTWLNAHPKITLGIDSNWEPYVLLDDKGDSVGIEPDLIARINELTGANIRLVTGEWSELVEKAKAREIDGLAVSAYHKERAEHFLFTDSPYTVSKYIFTSSLNIRNMEELAGRHVGLR